MKTIAKYGNCFQNNCPVTINSMFNECSAVYLHSNALQVIRVCGAAAPRVFNSNYLFVTIVDIPGLAMVDCNMFVWITPTPIPSVTGQEIPPGDTGLRQGLVNQ